jgi:hypothetical protein
MIANEVTLAVPGWLGGALAQTGAIRLLEAGR